MANVPHKVRNYFKLELLLEHSQILLRSLFKNRYSLFNSGNLWNNTQLCGSNYLANIIGKNKKINLTLTPMQKTSISNGDLTKWDISTLIILLLYDDRPKILTQQQVDREDQLLEELRSIRNRIMHHPTKSIDDLEFNQLWTDLIDILAGLGGDRNELNKQNNDSVFDVHSQFINEENVKEASRLNSLGTQSYKNDQYSDAIAFFTQAISLTDVSDTDRAVFYSNISASRLALCNNSNDEQYQALEDAKHARRLRLIWWKGHFRVGQVYAAINEHEKAIVSFERALVLDPSRAEIQNALYSSRQKYGIQSRYEYLDPRYTPRTLSEHLNETKVDQGVKLSDRLRRERKDPVEADVLKGHQYEHGDIGIEQDYKQAARYFDKAASQGNAEGIYNFARLTDHGLGVKQDHIAATKLFELAAEKPLPNVGVAEAQHALGLRYAEGVGAEKNLPFAAYWYQRAVDNDCAESANNLATMYLEGNGVEKNLEKAEQLFHLSAKMGDPNAMLTLAQLFVRKNDSKMAKSWHEQACESGNRFARMCRDEFEKFSKFRQDFVNNVPPVLLQMLNQQIDILNSLDAAKTIYRAVDQPSIISYYNELAELANDGSITAKNMCDALDHWSTAFKLLIKTESLTEIEENTFVHELSQCYRIEHIVSQYFDFKIREKINEIIDKVFERITKQLRDGTSQLDEDVRICYVIAHMDSKESTLLFLKQCKEKYPKCIYFFEHAAAINGFLEKYEDLLYEANCGLELDPNYTELLYFRAVALRLIHRDMNQAIEAYQNFLSSAPKDHRKVPESYYSMANCYFMCSTQTDRSDIIKQKYQQGLEAEKLQMPCFLPYQSNSKTVLELNLNINLELRRLKTEPDPYRVRLITKHRESENNRSQMSEFSKGIIVSKTHAPLLKQSIAKSLVGLKPISLKEMVSQKDHVYSDYVITLTIIEETRFWTPSIRLIVEDENHDCERMFIYAFPPNEGQYLVTKVFRSGNRMQVINPYLRFGAYDLERMIRVDDFSSILMLDEKEKTN